jgi:tricarballylate dehydrogenase
MKTESCDVVVVGFGNAAQSAAFSAYQGGAKVIVIEKAPENKRGGNTWHSHGAQFRHCHNGIEDEKPLLPHIPESEWAKIRIEPYTEDDFYADLMRVTRGRAIPELAEMLVKESYPTVRWMRESGVEFEILYGGAVPDGEGNLRWHHGASFVHSKDGGAGLVQGWQRVLKKHNIDIRFDTGAQKLITDDKGGVTGIICQTPDGLLQINCKAVVLACGGFQANPAMRVQYLGAGWDVAKCRGSAYDTGDGHVMAQEIGAQVVGHWGGAHATPIDADAGEYEGGFLDPETRRHRTHRYAWTWGIMVNTNGKRFIDEGEDFHAYTYAKTGHEIVKQPGSVAYQIFDQKMMDAVGRQKYSGCVEVKADTIRELAEKLEISVDGLVQTVEEYNAACLNDRPFSEVTRDGLATRGISPPKTNWATKIDKPPYVAYACTGGLTFTFGGLRVDPNCQVLNKINRPIRGLYAAGEITGGFFYYNYPSGSGLTRGAVTGRVAGRSAAAAL